MGYGKSISKLKNTILKPSLSSQYEVDFKFPSKVKQLFGQLNIDGLNSVNLMCSEASLPGSRLATLELTNDHTGVTERNVHRRIYDDSVDFTFYVDAYQYLPIKLFEIWMGYCVGQEVPKLNLTRAQALLAVLPVEVIDPLTNATLKSNSNNYNYRMNWPKDYKAQEVRIRKMERDVAELESSPLVYQFVDAFPVSMTTSGLSYNGSEILKTTVSMSFSRYYIENLAIRNIQPQDNNSANKVTAGSGPDTPATTPNAQNPGFTNGPGSGFDTNQGSVVSNTAPTQMPDGSEVIL